jgi:hypothetical protein
MSGLWRAKVWRSHDWRSPIFAALYQLLVRQTISTPQAQQESDLLGSIRHQQHDEAT